MSCIRQVRFGVLILVPLACAAQSGGSVELYGRVDMSVNFARNAKGSDTHLASDGSLWGLRGSEDLGAGRRANFTIDTASMATGVVPAGTGVTTTQFGLRHTF